ncbi:MAG: hypothetical protein ABEI52_03130 [Halobacteriaceae archaeon]
MQENLQTIAAYSKYLRQTETRRDELPTDDDVEALLFFLYRSFHGARRVELSREYFQHSKDVIETERAQIGNVLDGGEADDWKETIRTELETEIGNSADCQMVISLIEWLSDDSISGNIVQSSQRKIKNGELAEHHREIRKNVFNVGPKKASLYLRDIVAIANLESTTEGQWEYIIPIDTQIATVASAVLEEDIQTDSWRHSARRIADVCRQHSISPVEFDEGAWYIGANALGILLDSISELDPAAHYVD